MKRETELAKNTFIIALGTFLPKLTTLITLPILTAYLTKVEYGNYDLIATLIALLLPIATLKIDAAAFRFLIDCRDNEKETNIIISTIYIFVIPVSILVTIIASLFFNVSLVTKFLICLYFIINTINEITMQIIRGINKNLTYSIVAIIKSIINMIFIVLLVYYIKKGLNGLLISMFLATTFSTILLLIKGKIFKRISIKNFKKEKLKELLSYSYPILPNSLSSWIINLSDRLIVTFFMGVETNAIYAVANKIPHLFTTFQGTFTTAWQENASIVKKDEDVTEYYSNMFDSILNILTGLMSALIACTPILFMIFIKGDYKEAYNQMPFLFGGMLFSAISSFLSGIYVAYKKTKSIGITTICAAFINFLINIIFIKKIGLYAASLSTFISFMFLAIYRMIDVQKFQKVKIKIPKMLSYCLVLVIMSLISSYNNFYWNIFNFFFGIIFTFFINRNIIYSILKKIGLKK